MAGLSGGLSAELADLGFAGIGDLADAYRDGRTSPVAALDRYLARIAELDTELGAWQAVYADEARAAAEAATAAIRSGHRIGPFHGIPFALKDIVDIEGRVTTGGCAAWRERISPQTATIARRLIAAGGILLGKTKTVEMAMGGWGTNQRMGTPRNPWDPNVARTPGGSSSGSGVAVAAGLAACAIGTDTGGSVRLPAAYCGIVGLKVTERLLPTDGIIPLSHTLDTPGPMTRSVEDTALMFETLLGRHPGDTERDRERRAGLFAAVDRGAQGLRLGSLSEAERQGVADDVLAVYDEALERLRSLGADIVPFEPPSPFDTMKDGCFAIIAAEGYYHHGELYEDETAAVDEDVRPRILAGRGLAARDYIEALEARERESARFLERMRALDAVLTPTTATAALPLEDVDQGDTPARFTRTANYLALCALNVPAGLTASGLPVGLQIMARGNDEAMAIRAGAALEAARGPLLPPPIGAP